MKLFAISIIVVFTVAFLFKVSNETAMTNEYWRQANALERIADALEGRH